MTAVFFRLIPRILFEPVAVAAVLGIITALIYSWKKRNNLFWFVACSVVFMIGWRLVIHIISSRYASILIYPAIIFGVYFCFQLEDILKLVPKVPEKVRRIVPWLFIIGLSIACIVKILHVNPYADYIPYNCAVVKQDAVKFANPVILAEPDNKRRYQYYSGLKVIPLEELESGAVDETRMRMLLPYHGKKFDAVYVFVDERSGDLPLTSTVFAFADGECRLLSWQDHNRRKKKQLRVYRYLPPPAEAGKKQ